MKLQEIQQKDKGRVISESFTFCSATSDSDTLWYFSYASASSTNKLESERNNSRPLQWRQGKSKCLAYNIKLTDHLPFCQVVNPFPLRERGSGGGRLYLIRSFLALSACCAAKPASLSDIFLFFHCINNSGVIGVEDVNFAR